MIYAENEILGNIKCLLMPGCLLLISLLTPGSTVACRLTGYSRDQFKRSKNTYGSECAQVNAFLGFSSYTPQGIGLGTQNGDVSEEGHVTKDSGDNNVVE